MWRAKGRERWMGLKTSLGTGQASACRRLASAEALARVPGHAGLELAAQGGVVKAFADQHQLILGGRGPVAVVNRKALAGQMEDVAPITLIEPEDSLGTKHPGRHLIVEEVLELAQRKRTITLERKRGESFDRLMIRMGPMVVVVMATVIVMVVIMAAMIVIFVIMGAMFMILVIMNYVIVMGCSLTGAVVMIVPMVMAVTIAVIVIVVLMHADAMVVVAGIVALLGHHLVALEQPHAQQQR